MIRYIIHLRYQIIDRTYNILLILREGGQTEDWQYYYAGFEKVKWYVGSNFEPILQREVNQASITYMIKSGKPLTVAFGIIKGGVEFR